MKTSGVIKLQYIRDGKLEQARALRRNMTHAEELLWQRLRRNQLGVKFRRQQIINGFIADFFCESARLVIEVDGSVHDAPKQKRIDEYRRNIFVNRGLKEIRFANEQVESHLDAVVEEITSHLFPVLEEDMTQR